MKQPSPICSGSADLLYENKIADAPNRMVSSIRFFT